MTSYYRPQPHNHATSFVGRRREVDAVRRLLSSSRLVTITGSSGVGKSRLARRLAHEGVHALPDGARLVELATLEQECLLAEFLAAVLDLHDQACTPPLETVSSHLAGKRLLLVLDHCDHLPASCAVLARTLLDAAPGLRILATSNTALHAEGESLFPVLPMPTPSTDRAHAPSTLKMYGATQLFTARASSASPDFTVNTRTAGEVALLCRRADGFPLAIELAAARLGSTSLPRVLYLVDRHFRHRGHALTPTTRPPDTVEAMIDWSFGMCSPQERHLWARLSVFAGDFDLAAAGAVYTGDAVTAEDVFAVMNSLVNKGIVLRSQCDPTDGGPRYRLVEPLRDYGRRHLPARTKRTSPQLRHHDYYLSLATRAAADRFGPRETLWLNRLRRDRDNLRTALEFSARVPNQAAGTGTGLKFATVLQHFWASTGTLHEGLYWLTRILPLHPEPTSSRAGALTACAHLAVRLGQTVKPRQMLAEARQLAHTLSDIATLNDVNQVLALVHACEGDLPGAMTAGEQALTGYQEAGDLAGTCSSLFHLSMHATLLRDDAASRWANDCLTLAVSSQASRSMAYALWASAFAKWRRGDLEQAAMTTNNAAELMRSFGDKTGTALCLRLLAWISTSNSQHERAARLFGATRSGQLPRVLGIAQARYCQMFDEQCEHDARATLGKNKFEAALHKGSREGPILAAAYESSVPTTRATVSRSRVPSPRGQWKASWETSRSS
jgi:predicted ATPase